MRQSNIELLRIISMLMVIMVHLDGASVGLPTPGSMAATTADDAWRIAVEAITIVGVNCFTLISGYFGIRARLGSLVRFALMCMFYSVGLYTLSALAPHGHWSWSAWGESWMVFTHTDLWYVPAYLVLYLLSPMLNSAVAALPFRRFTLWLGLFVVANVWCGWGWGANFNPTGYTPMQLIMMYLIGQWLHRALPLTHCRLTARRVAGTAATAYAVSVTVTAILAVWMQPAKVYAYNSPWVIASSVTLFTCFASMNIKPSAAINNLARGAFAAYLVHKNPAVWGGFIRPTAIMVWGHGSLWLYTGFTVGFTAAIYVASSLADAARRFIFRKCESLLPDKVEVKA